MRCDIIILFLLCRREEEGDYLQIATTWRAAEEAQCVSFEATQLPQYLACSGLRSSRLRDTRITTSDIDNSVLTAKLASLFLPG